MFLALGAISVRGTDSFGLESFPNTLSEVTQESQSCTAVNNDVKVMKQFSY